MRNKSLGIIFRIPEYGKVKKRLALEIGHERALSIYREMLITTIDKVLSFNGLDIYGFYDGGFPEALSSKYKNLVLVKQEGKDLGEKMYRAVSYLYGNHYDRIILIGSDSPDLPLEYITEAFSRLDSFDIIIGPSKDGGYYLIGMKKPLDIIFRDIPWGSREVLVRTISKIEKEDLSYFLLPKWYDIDNLETLKKWQEGLISVEDIAL